jgi:hypothetical protein
MKMPNCKLQVTLHEGVIDLTGIAAAITPIENGLGNQIFDSYRDSRKKLVGPAKAAKLSNTQSGMLEGLVTRELLGPRPRTCGLRLSRGCSHE